MSSSHGRVLTDSFELISLLSKADEESEKSNFKLAYQCYVQVIEGYMVLIDRETDEKMKNSLMEQADEFMQKAKEMKKKMRKKNVSTYQSEGERFAEKAKGHEKEKDYKEALKCYLKAITFYVNYVKSETKDSSKNEAKKKIHELLKSAETLKRRIKHNMDIISKNLKDLIQLNPKEFTELSVIGKGTYGKVKKCRWVNHYASSSSSTEIIVAIKEFKMLNLVELKQIENEFRIMKKMNHERVVQTFGYYVKKKKMKFCVVMEFLNGGDLYSFKTKYCLSYYDKFNIVKQMIESIDYLHNVHSILHRDIKTLNFLVSVDEKSIKLTDFGLSLIRMNSCSFSNKKQQQQKDQQKSEPALGTARFLAPELCITEDPLYSQKSDIYALGISIFEVVCGKIPYENVHDDTSILCLVKYEDKRPIIPEITPQYFRKMIQWCWQRDPKYRPNTKQLLKYVNDNEKMFFKTFPKTRSAFDDSDEN